MARLLGTLLRMDGHDVTAIEGDADLVETVERLEPEAVDVNFAVHLPWIDRLLGTAYLPERWPARYGVAGEPVPEGWMTQLVHPFRKPPRA